MPSEFRETAGNLNAGADAQGDLNEACGPAEAAVKAVINAPGVTNLDSLIHQIIDAVRPHLYREAAEAITTSKRLRSYTDDHMGDIEMAAEELRAIAARQAEGSDRG